MTGRLLPTGLAALALGVPEATVRKWAQRGKLTQHGTARRRQYDLDELDELAARRADDTSDGVGC